MSPQTRAAEPAAGTIQQITHLAAALRAPRITESAARLADHARDPRLSPRGLPGRRLGTRGRRP
jgi:hypothetical protein